MTNLEADFDTPKTLDDICEFIVDCLHKTAPTQLTGYPSIRTPNVGRGRLILDGVNRVSEEVYHEWTKRAVPRPGDLILAREAPAGNVAIIKEGQTVCLGQRTVHLRPDQEKVNSDFLCYYLLAPRQQGLLLAGETGATAGHVNMRDIRRLDVGQLPSPATQAILGQIIATYDDLIENNRRRIALLEAAARLLYREWFVRFYFPGHEHVEITDGLPEGWERRALFDEADATYGHAFKSDLFNDAEEGLPVVRIRDVRNGTSATWTTEEAPEDRRLANGDFLIGMDGDFHMNFWVGGIAWLNQRVTKIDGGDRISAGFLRFALEKPINDLNEIITGTTVKHLGAKHLKQIKLMVPPSGLLDEANSFFQNTRDMVVSLGIQNLRLGQARYLLLPRLINGEISV